GAAAALSAWIGGALSRRVAARTLWAASQAVMALGVLLPALAPQRVDALIASAVCVGGTFIVVTLAGLQEARRVGGPAAPRLMAAMTAAFGMGQVLGPLASAPSVRARTACSPMPPSLRPCCSPARWPCWRAAGTWRRPF